MQQAAILGDEQEQKPIDDSQDLAVVVLRGKRPGLEPGDESFIAGVRDKAASQCFDGLLHADVKVFQDSRALVLGEFAPLFEPKVLWFVAFEA